MENRFFKKEGDHFTKLFSNDFTVIGSLSEASTSSVNKIKCLQTLANIENTEQTNKDEKLQEI